MLRLTSLSLALSLLVSASLFAQPSYQAVRTSDAITVDGELDEFTWSIAPQVGRFRSIREHSGTPQLPTQAMLAWDDANLYVAFVCADPRPWGTMMERDMTCGTRRSSSSFSIRTATAETTPNSKSARTTSSSIC